MKMRHSVICESPIWQKMAGKSLNLEFGLMGEAFGNTAHGHLTGLDFIPDNFDRLDKGVRIFFDSVPFKKIGKLTLPPV